MREFPRIVHSHLRHIMQSKTVIIEAELIYRSDGSFIKVPAAAYSARVRALEAEGCDTSDAQGIADAEFLATISVPLSPKTRSPQSSTLPRCNHERPRLVHPRRSRTRRLPPQRCGRACLAHPRRGKRRGLRRAGA